MTLDFPQGQLPPQSREAEKGVLGALLREGVRSDDPFDLLDIGDFYWDAHQQVYAVYLDHRDKRKPFDLVTCFESLKERKQLENAGGPAYLGELFEAAPTGANLYYYAEIVKDRAKRRFAAHLATEVIRDVHSFNGVSIASIIDGFTEKLYALAAGKKNDDPVSLDTAMLEALHAIDLRSKGQGDRPIPTGLDSLDNIMGGLWNTNLIVVAARPSVGKTSLGMALALQAIVGVPAMFFSMEMKRMALANRALAVRSSVNLNSIRGMRSLTSEDIAALIAAADQRTAGKLWIQDRPNLSVAEVSRQTHAAIKKHGIKMIVVDYLGRMKFSGSREDTETRMIGETVKGLKNLALDCNIPVVCLAQLNRQSTNRSDPTPKMSDLRGSGEIEQEADDIILLHPTSEPNSTGYQTMDLQVEKQRMGPTGVAKVIYNRACTRFENDHRNW